MNNNYDFSNIQLIKEDFKRLRKKTAIQLPSELKQDMIPKYVVYYKECYNKEKKLYREFFKIEKHPLMTIKKVVTSSKSNKITILEKLEQIKKLLYDIENNNEINLSIHNLDINDLSNNDLSNNDLSNIILPKYISLKLHEKDNNKYFLSFDKKYMNNRQTHRSLYKTDINLKDNLINFINIINNKFNTNIIYE
tara:strand:+ start:2414 stop:2995 length:582 start_codon:yes stop_codon:yes gene_type:complete